MKTRLIFVGVCLLAAAPFAAAPQTGNRGMATVDALVLNADGQPVTDLVPGDFDVLVDGAPAAMAQVSRTPADVAVVMLVDGTASQPLKRYELLAGVQTGLIPSLQPGDRARLALLGNPTTFSQWLSADRTAASAFARTYLDRPPLEPSPIWDAIDAAVKSLADTTEPRVLMLMSDGRSTGNRLSMDDAARSAIAGGVSISVVSEGGEWLIPQFGDAPDRARSDASLKWLADTTGGLYLPDGTARRTLKPQMNAFAYVTELVNTPSKPAPLVSTIMSSLRQRYRLQFEVRADGRVHTLDVRTKRPGVTVRAPRLIAARSSSS
jgi:hypothetical protein